MSKKRVGKTPKNDYIFKRIFGDIGCEGILKDFLEAVLDIEIENVKLGKSTELMPIGIDKKGNRLDVRVDLVDGTKIAVEMQMESNDDFVKRSEAYASKLYINDFEKNMKYKDLQKVIIIFVLNFEYMKNTKTYHPYLKLEEQVEHKEIIDEKEIHFLELPKFRKQKTNLDSKLEQWMAFIDYEDKELIEMAIKKNKRIREANDKYKMLTSKDIDAYLTYVMAEMDRNSDLDYAERKGETKGRLAANKETAKKMKKLGLSANIIFEATGITEEEQEVLV